LWFDKRCVRKAKTFIVSHTQFRSSSNVKGIDNRIIPILEMCLKGKIKMLTLKQEIELLLSILSVVEDDNEHANISLQILKLNELLKTRND
jgi:hypothetical protein